jgi:uncharacterized protein (TIGR00369 family)
LDGLAFVVARIGKVPMPMAELFALELLHAERGVVRVVARPSSQHYNPLGVVQGGFAGTVLDIALGLVCISVLVDDAAGVATTDLSVRYLRPILESTGAMKAEASILHAGRTMIVAQATLSGSDGKNYACAQSTSIVSRYGG